MRFRKQKSTGGADCSPDTDSAFSDDASSMLSSSESSSTSSTSVNGKNIRHPPQGGPKKVLVDVYCADGSTKESILVDAMMPVGSALKLMAEKSHVDCHVKWGLVERLPDLHMERCLEDDEKLLRIVSSWKPQTPNRLIFAQRPEKYDLFRRPERYLLDPYDRASTEDVMASPWDANARQALLQKCINNANEASTTLMEGPLWLKAEGKKSWKKFHFILRDGNLFQTTKSKKGSVHDVHCVASLATIRVFNGIGWKRKHKAPTDFCLALKPPEVQEKRAHIRYLCAENEFIKWGWYSMLRLTLGPPQQLVDNYNAQLGVLSMEDEAMMIGRSDSMVSNASSGCISEADEETGFDAEYPEGGTIKRKPAQQASPPHLGQHIAPGGGPMAAVAAANPHAAQMQAQHAAQAMEQHRHLVNMEAMQSRALNGTDGRPTTASSACSDETLPLPPPPVEDVPQVLTPTNVMNSSQMLPPPPPSNCTPDKDVGGVAAAAPGPYLQQQHQQHQQHQHPPAAAVAITSPNQPMGAIREDIYPCGVIRTMFPGGTPEEGITTGVKQMNLLQQMPTQPPPNLQALLGKQEPFNRPTNGVASAVQPQFKAQPSSSKEPGARQKKITFSEFVHSVDDAQWEPLKGREDGMPVNCANTSDEHYNEKDVSNWVLDSLRHCSTPSSTAATTTTATSAGSNGSATALSHSHVDSLSRPKLYNGRTVPNCFSPEEVAQQQRSMMVASVTAAAPVAITEVDSRKMPPPPPRRSDGTHLSQV